LFKQIHYKDVQLKLATIFLVVELIDELIPTGKLSSATPSSPKSVFTASTSVIELIKKSYITVSYFEGVYLIKNFN